MYAPNLDLSPETLKSLDWALSAERAWKVHQRDIAEPGHETRFLHTCARNVPFYQAYFRQNTSLPDDSLQSFPTVHRGDYAQRRDEFINNSLRSKGPVYSQTSGVAGPPLTIPFTTEAWYELNYTFYEHLFERHQSLAESLLPLNTSVVMVSNKINRHDEDIVLPSAKMSCFRRRVFGGASSADSHLCERLRADTIPVLYGKPSYLMELSEVDALYSRQDERIRPLLLLSSGENLYPDQRAHLEEWFRAKLVDAYASTEGGLIAMQCQMRKGYHVLTGRVQLEILTKDGELCRYGTGEVVLTNWINSIMPVIRYRTGDYGTLTEERCPCGQAGDMLLDFHGREPNLIRVGKNDISTRSLEAKLLELPIKSFQFIQTANETFDVYLQPKAPFKADMDSMVARILTEIMGEQIHVNVFFSERLTPRGGKARRFLSGPEVQWHKRPQT